jgi:hypothetical protein
MTSTPSLPYRSRDSNYLAHNVQSMLDSVTELRVQLNCLMVQDSWIAKVDPFQSGAMKIIFVMQ